MPDRAVEGTDGRRSPEPLVWSRRPGAKTRTPRAGRPWHAHAAVRLLWCLSGAAAGISTVLAVAAPSPFLPTSLGGTAVFLFGFTRASAVQPRALFGGHLGAACIGIGCYQAFGDSAAVYALAVALTLAFMLLTRTVHPPAGANPILMIHVHAGWAALWQPVFLGVVALVLIALVWSRLYPGLVRYPLEPWAPSPPHVNWGGWSV